MKRFENEQRIVVTKDDHPLKGLSGIVVRLRISDRGAWVDMGSKARERDYPFAFPSDDHAGRGNDVLLLPEWCEVHT